MAYTKEELVEFAAQALDLRQQAHKLELKQAKLNEHAPGAEGRRYRKLGAQIRALRAKAAELYAPDQRAFEEDLTAIPDSTDERPREGGRYQ